MRNQIMVSLLFNEKLKQWGLRGDPYLWEDMKQAFSTVPFPITAEEFTNKLEAFFLELTGSSLT